MSDRVRLIEHGIVLQDFSGLQDVTVALPLIAEARRFMETQPKGTALVLTDLSGSRYNQKVVEAIKELAEHHRPWVKASALMGLSPLMRVIYRAIVALTRREIHVCETREEAMAYLLSRAKASP